MTENKASTNINWYPGHMAKARREMQEKIGVVDMVIELRDARIPASSINPLLDEVIGSKPRLVVLSKADKADEAVTASWQQFFQKEGYKALALDLRQNNVSNVISQGCLEVMKDKVARLKARGMKHVEVKAMVVGVPNVGKSTLINSVSRRKAARTGDHPGVTKSLQWIKVSPDVALLDTPGVLWPKFDDQQIAMKLAVCGSISDNVLPIEELIRYALSYLHDHYPGQLVKRYGVEMCDDPDQLLERIALSRRFLDSNGQPDLFRTRNVLLNELRDGLVGRISWEVPDEDAQ